MEALSANFPAEIAAGPIHNYFNRSTCPGQRIGTGRKGFPAGFEELGLQNFSQKVLPE